MLKQDEINRLRAANLPPRAMIIDGEICQALSGRTREVISPIDGTVLTTIPDALPKMPSGPSLLRALRSKMDAGRGWRRRSVRRSCIAGRI